MDKAKRSGKVRYWINFRVNGKQRREPVGFSLQEAKDADGKRRSQKRENRIFDMLPESKMTFSELSEWYLNLESVKRLSSYDRVKIALNRFNAVFGSIEARAIKPIDLENYQGIREGQGVKPATIDMELVIAKIVINKAFDNDMVDGRVLKAFRNAKRKLKAGANARKRLLSFDEYQRLTDNASVHFRPILITCFNTGMRLGELRALKWDHIDRKGGFIRLPASMTKEGKPKSIPINRHVEKVLASLPRSLSGYVFCYNGKPIRSACGTNKSIRNACKKAGISYGRDTGDGLIFHDIRRTFKTNMLRAGVDKIYRDLIVGHSLTGMDIHYIVPTDEDLTAAILRFTEWLDGQSAGLFKTVDQNVDQNKVSI